MNLQQPYITIDPDSLTEEFLQSFKDNWEKDHQPKRLPAIERDPPGDNVYERAMFSKLLMSHLPATHIRIAYSDRQPSSAECPFDKMQTI